MKVEVGDERMDGCCWIECRIFLVLAVHFFVYLAADAREWRQKHAAFEQPDDRSIECNLQVDVVSDLAGQR